MSPFISIAIIIWSSHHVHKQNRIQVCCCCCCLLSLYFSTSSLNEKNIHLFCRRRCCCCNHYFWVVVVVISKSMLSFESEREGYENLVLLHEGPAKCIWFDPGSSLRLLFLYNDPFSISMYNTLLLAVMG